MERHRKTVHSFDIPGEAHALTFTCFRRLQLLSKDRTRRWFVVGMEAARKRLDFALWAYVIMPEHVHVIVWPQQPIYQMGKIKTALKVEVSRKALRYLRVQAPRFLEKLIDVQPNGDVHHRFWQRGGGYDRNINEPLTLETMIEYIHNNPVRRGLVEKATDWVWSSARYYAGYANVPIKMDPMPSLDG
jgi:putative transposase